MFPLSDINPTARTPVVTYTLLVVIAAAWLLLQGAGLDAVALISSVCNLGLVPGELTGQAPPGTAVPIAEGMACVVDDEPWTYLTPITSMFMHGSWGHVIGNAWFLKVFGDNVEDAMTRPRFLAFYLLCGLAAAAAQVAVDPASPVPMVGASGAISGVMGAYVVLHPRAPVRTLLFIVLYVRVIMVPAWVMLMYWFALQLLLAVPVLAGASAAESGGVAVMAHVGGFAAGAALIKLFARAKALEPRTSA